MSIALIIIDVQHEFFEKPPTATNAALVIDRINGLSSRARESAIPVFFIQHHSSTGTLKRDSPGWRLTTPLVMAPSDRIVAKTTADSFLRTELMSELQRSGISKLVVCGYATEFCVDTSIRRAAALGYEVIIAADAHTTHDKPHASARQIVAHHNATLPEITSFGARISCLAAAEIPFS